MTDTVKIKRIKDLFEANDFEEKEDADIEDEIEWQSVHATKEQMVKMNHLLTDIYITLDM